MWLYFKNSHVTDSPSFSNMGTVYLTSSWFQSCISLYDLWKDVRFFSKEKAPLRLIKSGQKDSKNKSCLNTKLNYQLSSFGVWVKKSPTWDNTACHTIVHEDLPWMDHQTSLWSPGKSSQGKTNQGKKAPQTPLSFVKCLFILLKSPITF